MSESTEESRTNISLESEPKKLQPSLKKPEKKFLCKICSKNFSTKGNLKNHINTIHNNYYPFKCPYSNCSHSYSNKSRLEVHIRTHTGIKPFQCNLCNKFFNEKGNLKTHINFHKNIRTFQCKICNKKYKTNGHLKDHIQIQHLKIKKFKCEKCGCLFGRKSSLNSHMKIYTGNKMYVCEIKGCGKKFYEKGELFYNGIITYDELLCQNEDILVHDFMVDSSTAYKCKQLASKVYHEISELSNEQVQCYAIDFQNVVNASNLCDSDRELAISNTQILLNSKLCWTANKIVE